MAEHVIQEGPGKAVPVLKDNRELSFYGFSELYHSLIPGPLILR